MAFVDRVVIAGKEAKDNPLQNAALTHVVKRCADCNRAGQLDGVAVNPRADRRKRDARHPALLGAPQAVGVGRVQEIRLAVVAAMPDRPHGVDDDLCRQVACDGGYGLTCRAALRVHLAALGQYRRSARAVDCAIHTATAPQAGVGRVDDGINLKRRDVALIEFERGGA